jgi:hypothetical protein
MNKVHSKSDYSDDDEHIDHTLASKGIIVAYRKKQHKQKVRLTVFPNMTLDGDEPDQGNTDKLVRRLEKHIGGYFDFEYALDDFALGRMCLMTDIDVHKREKAAAYIKVLHNIGRVKGFSPPRDNRLDDKISFCLEGNSNSLAFMIYDLEGLLREQLEEADSRRKQLKEGINKSEGLLRAEVHLMKPKAIRAYTDKAAASGQIAELCGRGEKIFLDTFQRVVPFGDFYKKDKAIEIIRKKETDNRMKRRMMHLVALVPEKKSLLLAQKALNYRRIDEVMKAFESAEVSPVTISKRHDIKKLDNLYKYL